MKMRGIVVMLLMILILSCGKEKKEEAQKEKPLVVVTNYPLYYFAQTIGEELVDVRFPEINGDPAYWKPSAEQLAVFQHADQIFVNGASYEKWMEMVSLPSSRIINTSVSFENNLIEVDEGLPHSHGNDGEHVHKGTAITTWLNFRFAALQAEAVLKGLVNLVPEQKAILEKNFKNLDAELLGLDIKMRNTADALGDRKIIASHPVYQYLQSAYNLEMTSLHLEPDEMPAKNQWEELEGLFTNNSSSVMLWESEPLEEIRFHLDSLNIQNAVFDPCANRPESGDFIDVMVKNIARLSNLTATN